MSNIYAVYDPETGMILSVYVVEPKLLPLQMKAWPGREYLLVGPEGDTGEINLKNIHEYRVEGGRLVKK